ncbi:hypothetical protein E5Q_04555 [Mixia osmundae IAM 14324]|uniref:IQ domain-containing protein IQM6 n=1 Tax=Mixia osmundae (strain CBS 9802 / IAM 14324 / JCM 22182 / KY 12970) TaxID=764103 RepID=G7E4W5_MIXOS|nr:hypothetical protein E5Q_04555 [Mixia osmundae IAM 14324]
MSQGESSQAQPEPTSAPPKDSRDQDESRSKAALLVQSHYRGFKSRREQRGMYLSRPPKKSESSSTDQQTGSGGDRGAARAGQEEDKPKGHSVSSNARWNDGLNHVSMKNANKDAADGSKNDAATRWKRGGLYAGRIMDGSTGAGSDEDEGGDTPSKDRQKGDKEAMVTKQLEKQHWLELVDEKHRYGSNLKFYWQAWSEKDDTNQNFFHWLDHGDGKDFDAGPDCPRERLEKERITYLSVEQRQNYRLYIKEGKLFWRKNDVAFDTGRGKWQDGGPDKGIVRVDDKDVEAAKKRGDLPSSDTSDSSSDENPSDHEAEEHSGYGHRSTDEKGKAGYWTSPKFVMDHLLRKTTKQNTWIYVADTKFNIYSGLKTTGSFQHSSFLYGSRVTSAGLIKAQDGMITSLSPLSGHYRAGTEHFKKFVAKLEEMGVDMSKVNISKSLITIGALEKYGAASKKKKSLTGKLKEKLRLSKPDDDPAKKEAQWNEKVQQGAKDKEEEQRLNGTGDAPADDKQNGSSEKSQDTKPYEGVPTSQLSEDQKDERGIAFVQSAFNKASLRSDDGKQSLASQVKEAGEADQA